MKTNLLINTQGGGVKTMKKTLVVLLSTFFGLLFFSSAAFALAGSSPHGNFTPNSDLCNDCHGMHNRNNKRLLTKSSTTEFCFDCHGQVGVGSYYSPGDPVDPATGVVGFDWANAKINASTYTIHNVFDQGGSITYDPTDKSLSEDSGFASATTDTRFSYTFTSGFTCGSCHDPHGSTLFRNLRTKPLGATPTVVENKTGNNSVTVYLEATRPSVPTAGDGKAPADRDGGGVAASDFTLAGAGVAGLSIIAVNNGAGEVWSLTLDGPTINGQPFTVTYNLVEPDVTVDATRTLTEGQDAITYNANMDTFCTVCHDRNIMQKATAGASSYIRHPSNVALGVVGTTTRDNYDAYNPAIQTPTGLVVTKKVRSTGNPNPNADDLTSTLAGSTTYSYRVAAIDDDGNTTLACAAQQVTTDADGTTNIIEVKWDSMPGAYKYRIYRGNPGAETLYAELPAYINVWEDRNQITPLGGALPGASTVGASPLYGKKVPTEATGGPKVFCLSCHNAHGSSYTKLLKEQGHNTCQQCHNK